MLSPLAILFLIGTASAEVEPKLWPFTGGSSVIGNVLSPVSSVIGGFGKLVGSVFGGVWGAIVPESMNKAAINAACGKSFDSNANTNLATGFGNVLGTAVGTVWSAVVPKSVNTGSIQSANTLGQTGQDLCTDFKFKIDFTASALMDYSSTAERDRLLQAILSAWSTSIVDKKDTAGLTIYFVSEKSVEGATSRQVTFRIVGLAKKRFDVARAYQKFKTLFNQNPPKEIRTIASSAKDNVVITGKI